jgi:hypothetical protein
MLRRDAARLVIIRGNEQLADGARCVASGGDDVNRVKRREISKNVKFAADGALRDARLRNEDTVKDVAGPRDVDELSISVVDELHGDRSRDLEELRRKGFADEPIGDAELVAAVLIAAEAMIFIARIGDTKI